MARKVYNQEFKSEAVRLADKKGINKAAADLGIKTATLRRWKSDTVNPKSVSLEEAEKEMARLRKENEYLKKINDVLKKSHAIFSSDHHPSSKS